LPSSRARAGPARADILDKLKSGELDLLVGNARLFQDEVEFRDSRLHRRRAASLRRASALALARKDKPSTCWC